MHRKESVKLNYIEDITRRREDMNFFSSGKNARVSKVLLFTTRKQNSYLQVTVQFSFYYMDKSIFGQVTV